MTINTRLLGSIDYADGYAAMREFTQARNEDTPDELWLCEHPPVYTLGLAGKPEHMIAASSIPLVQTDRGGQITYHGPGQVVAYPLMDLRRRGYFVKEFVFRLEEAAIRTLAAFSVTGYRVRGAPGIYVRLDNPHGHEVMQLVEADLATRRDIGKIAALGIKVSQRGSYHGMSLNVAMDLAPYAAINPCGYVGLPSVDLATLGVHVAMADVQAVLAQELTQRLS